MKVLFCAAVLSIAFATNYANPLSQRYMIMKYEDGSIRLEDLQLPVPREGVAVTEEDINFYLYTQSNKNSPVHIPLAGFDGTIDSASNFDPAKPIYFSTHGAGGSYSSGSNQRVKNPVLDHHDVNFFVLDYHRPSDLFYVLATTTIPEVGRLASTFIEKLARTYSLNYADMTMTGQSLGGHVAGAIGQHLGGEFGRIVGLDPAWPLFHNVGPEKRLDPTDAKYVQVIHSNCGLKGYKTSIGHVDMYPNGSSMNQPGCGADWVGSCAHDRATLFFSESLSTEGYTATKCDTYENFLDGKCDENEKSYLGRYQLDEGASGDYFLQTKEAEPFSLG